VVDSSWRPVDTLARPMMQSVEPDKNDVKPPTNR